MNINDLKLFEAVSYYGSFTKAAKAMFTVQSNVSARIKSLEREFGTPLFSRTSHKVELTSAGEILMAYSKKINHLVAEAKQSVGGNQIIKGQVKIGFLETMMAVEGLDLVKRLTVKHPFIDLNFKSAMRDELINDVINYKLDAAFVPAPLNHSELEQHYIKKENIVVVAPKNCKSLDSLVKTFPLKAIVFDEGCVFRERLEAWLNNKGVVQYHKTTMNSVEGVINFIESGIGFSFLPYGIISTFYNNRKLTTFSLPRELGELTTVLIYRKDLPPLSALKAFTDLYLDEKPHKYESPV